MRVGRKSAVSGIFGLSLLAVSAFAGSPHFPAELDYSKLSPTEQREFESAAFLLNLRSLGVLEPNGVVCAQPGTDANGNPTYRFSVQDKAFETGSCKLSATRDEISAKLKALARATIEYQKALYGPGEKLPISVTGFADGQPFSTVGAQAKSACPDLASAAKVHGSYNGPLASSRASVIAAELSSVLGEAKPSVSGNDSPKIVGGSLANCPTRRQVVISFGSSPAVNASQTVGDFEPSSQVDGSVQLGLNAAVSVEILRAHARVREKEGKSPNTLDCPARDHDSCVWKHLQAVMTELGFDPNDAGCRATTMALADEVIGRAVDPGSKVGKRMMEIAKSDDPAWAKKWITEYTASRGKDRSELTECEASAELHLAMPTSDMWDTQRAKCPRKHLFSNDLSFIGGTAARSTLGQIRQLETRKASPAVASQPAQVAALEAQIRDLRRNLDRDYPGIGDFQQLSAYVTAGDQTIARRNISHNCVTPNLGVLAAGFEASPERADYFISPESLGGGNVRMGYSAKTFGNVFYRPRNSHGFGCSACGSGILMGKDGGVKFENGVVNRSNSISSSMDEVFGKDGMKLVRGETLPKGKLTAANFMAPTLYEIPNCAKCACVSSMKDALEKAFASGSRKLASAADGLVVSGTGKPMKTSDFENSCLFAPPVAHACPVGPNGHSEQSKRGAELARSLTYIDKALAPATSQITNDFRNVLASIETCGGSNRQAVKTVDYYQKLIDEVVCDTKKDPIVLPENKGNEVAECERAAKLLGAAKAAGTAN